jgi:hypothetical protein
VQLWEPTNKQANRTHPLILLQTQQKHLCCQVAGGVQVAGCAFAHSNLPTGSGVDQIVSLAAQDLRRGNLRSEQFLRALPLKSIGIRVFLFGTRFA